MVITQITKVLQFRFSNFKFLRIMLEHVRRGVNFRTHPVGYISVLDCDCVNQSGFNKINRTFILRLYATLCTLYELSFITVIAYN